MIVLEEGNLQITIGDAINARKFDDASHGLNRIASWSNRFPQYPIRRQNAETTRP